MMHYFNFKLLKFNGAGDDIARQKKEIFGHISIIYQEQRQNEH